MQLRVFKVDVVEEGVLEARSGQVDVLKIYICNFCGSKSRSSEIRIHEIRIVDAGIKK